MDKNRTIEMLNGIITMMLETIESLEAEITQLKILLNGQSAYEDSDRQLRDDVSKIQRMVFGDG